MKTVWKYTLVIDDKQSIVVTTGAKLLTVQIQNGMPCLWALVDPHEDKTDRLVVRMYGTGHPINGEPGEYIGTFQIHGALVFHVFKE